MLKALFLSALFSVSALGGESTNGWIKLTLQSAEFGKDSSLEKHEIEAKVMNVGPKGARLKTKKGSMQLNWAQMTPLSASLVGSESGYYHVEDSRTHTYNDNKLHMYIVSQRQPDGSIKYHTTWKILDLVALRTSFTSSQKWWMDGLDGNSDSGELGNAYPALPQWKEGPEVTFTWYGHTYEYSYVDFRKRYKKKACLSG